MDKTLKTIEFDRVLEILAGFAQSSLGRQKCLAALPSNDLNEIKLNLKLTTQAQNAYRVSASEMLPG